MTIIITAFERSPDGGKELARDMRIRWALEEVNQPYEVRLVSFRAMKEPAQRALHPPLLELAATRLLEREKSWYEERLPLVEDRVRDRLGQLSRRLDDADWLDGAFSAGNLMMVSVLLRLKLAGILDEYPDLTAYVARGEARPAYERAFHAQLAVYAAKPATG
jgi:glutathione S-transferase